jgi:predicted ATPase
LWMPYFLSYLARAYADLGNFDEAWRSIDEARTALETTKERWYDAEIHRMAGAPNKKAAARGRQAFMSRTCRGLCLCCTFVDSK